MDLVVSTRVRTVAAVVGLALVATLVVLVVTRGEGAAEDGPVVAGATPSEVVGLARWVQLPAGRLSVTVGRPVDEIPAAEHGGDAVEAGAGERFLPVQVDLDAGSGVPSDLYEPVLARDDVRPEVTVRLGRTDHELGAVAPGAERFYLRVAEADADTSPEIAVAYAGLTQTVTADGSRSTGRAAGVYERATSVATRPCRAGWTGEAVSGVRMSCRIATLTYPYLPEHGWAPRGRPWTLATVATTFRGARVAGPGGVRRCAAVPEVGAGSVGFTGATRTVTLVDTGAVVDGASHVSQQVAARAPAAGSPSLAVTRVQRCEVGGEVRTVRLSARLPLTVGRPQH